VRRAPRLLACALLSGLLVALAAPAAHAAPTILLLHGGGWVASNGSEMEAWRADFAAHGYRTIVVQYPLGMVTPSIDYTAALAREERLRGEPVIAYGVSSGGTIAAALAATGAVDGAVDVIGPTDFTRWSSPAGIAIMIAAKMSEAEKRSASPYWRLNARAAPLLIQCGRLDPITTHDQCVRYTARAVTYNSDTTLQSMLNAHSQWPADRDRARAWVQARWPANTSSTRRAPLRRLL
jgi:acetyl esterase/lipase